MEHVHQVTFDDFPKMLVELSREAIRAWCFVVFHVKNCFPNLLFSERSREKLVFWLTNLRDIIHPIIQAEVVVLRWSKQIFIELGDILFEVLLTLYPPLMFQGEGALLSMFAISNHLEVSSIVIPQKKYCYPPEEHQLLWLVDKT